jgi:heptosyltransferase III
MDNNGILITRTDRIGDVVLALPVIKTLAKVFPGRPLYFLVSSYAAPIVENYPGLTSVIVYDSADDSSKVNRTRQVTQQLRDLNIKTALMLFYDPEVLSMIRKAGIKERIGPLTKLFGMISYTDFTAQHRSKVQFHELEYNLNLLKKIGIKDKQFEPTLELSPGPSAHSVATEKLMQIGLDSVSRPYMVIHITCGGSALNWRYAYYAELASRLSEATGLSILLTGSEQDAVVLSSVKQHIKGSVYNTAGMFSLKELIAVIAGAKLFIGPSTGPMHIAAATGIPVAAIFSPIKVQSANRWGPYNKDSVVFIPKVNCPAKFNCIKEKCPSYNCMDKISIEEVFEKAKKLYDDVSARQMGLSFE